MTDADYQARTEKRIDSLMEIIEEQGQQIDRYEPVISYVGKLVELWERKFDTLPDNEQELCRIYRRAEGTA